MWWILGMILALAGGIYVGLGMPGLPGRKDRVVKPGQRRQLHQHRFLDWLRPSDRESYRERRWGR